MLTIPLYALLFIYLAFLVFFAAFILINIAHLFHTGTFNLTSFVVTVVVIVLTLLILWGTWFFLQDINWQTPLVNWNFSARTGLSVPDNGNF